MVTRATLNRISEEIRIVSLPLLDWHQSNESQVNGIMLITDNSCNRFFVAALRKVEHLWRPGLASAQDSKFAGTETTLDAVGYHTVGLPVDADTFLYWLGVSPATL